MTGQQEPAEIWTRKDAAREIFIHAGTLCQSLGRDVIIVSQA